MALALAPFGRTIVGAPIRLTQSLGFEGQVFGDFQITPDGNRVVYRAQQTTWVDELFSVAVTGGTAVRLNGPLVASGAVLPDFVVTSDGSRVIYRADQDVNKVDELYSVSTMGGPVTKLNGTMVSGGDVYAGFQAISDGTRVVYKADQITNEIPELFSVAIDGGAATRLNAPLPPGVLVGGDQTLSGFALTSDGGTVVYRTMPNLSSSPTPRELYAVAVSGGQVTHVTDSDPPEMDVYLGNWQISPDDDWVVYTGQASNSIQPYAVPIDGGAAIRLTPDDAERGASFAQVTADSKRVVFKGQLDTPNVVELYSAPIEGGTMTKLNDPSVGAGWVTDRFLLSPDGSRTVYGASQNGSGPLDLYSVATDGGPSIQLSASTVPDRDYLGTDFDISPDGSRVVYRADYDDPDQIQLYSVPIAGGPPVKLNASLPDWHHVRGFEITPDGEWVVYLAGRDPSVSGQLELYSVPIIGGEPFKISGELAEKDTVAFGFQISPDSRYVVYRLHEYATHQTHLYAARVIPEPSTFALTATGLLGLLGCWWRGRRVLASRRRSASPP